jgi:hypothetical protein
MSGSRSKTPRLSRAQLDELVEEATTDADGDSEQAVGFYTMKENDHRARISAVRIKVWCTPQHPEFAIRLDAQDAPHVHGVYKTAVVVKQLALQVLFRCHIHTLVLVAATRKRTTVPHPAPVTRSNDAALTYQRKRAKL